MDAATGEVLASVSAPTFDAQDVAASIRADDTSLINRPFAAFSAGSVFKVVLAAAAYEQGLDWFTHDCTGEIVVAGQTYRCAQGRAHGEVNLRGALEESCNTYFIKLGQLLGAEAIRDEAATLRLWHSGTNCPGPGRSCRYAAGRGDAGKPRPVGDVQLWAGVADRDAAANHRHDEHCCQRRGV